MVFFANGAAYCTGLENHLFVITNAALRGAVPGGRSHALLAPRGRRAEGDHRRSRAAKTMVLS